MDKCLCFRCKHELSIDDNWLGSEVALVSDEKALSDEDFNVTLMSCPYCGAHYEVYDTPMSEAKNYQFFNDKQEL